MITRILFVAALVTLMGSFSHNSSGHSPSPRHLKRRPSVHDIVMPPLSRLPPSQSNSSPIDSPVSSSLSTVHNLPTRCVFLGPPGSGKGTQAHKIHRSYGVKHLSVGDLLRAEIASGSDLGQQIKPIVASGGLVSDDHVLNVVRANMERMDPSLGYILDGFPRNVNQAIELDRMLEKLNKTLDCVIHFAIDDELIMDRVYGRLTHVRSGRTYHIKYNPPKSIDPPLDDITGEPLIRRSDDYPESFRKRLQTYHQNTEPLIDHYSKKSILQRIDASLNPDQVWSLVQHIIVKHQPT